MLRFIPSRCRSRVHLRRVHTYYVAVISSALALVYKLICIGRPARRCSPSAAVHQRLHSESLAGLEGASRARVIGLTSRGCSQEEEGAQHRGVTVCGADTRVYTHPHRVAGSSSGGSRDLWLHREVARRLIYFTVGAVVLSAIPPSSSLPPCDALLLSLSSLPLYLGLALASLLLSDASL